MRLELFKSHKLESRGMSCLQDNGRGDVVLQRVFPTGDADTPFVARLQSRKTPFRVRCYQIVTVEHRKIEKFARSLNANRMQTDILRTGATITVAKKAG
jgi:hypothetical protein